MVNEQEYGGAAPQQCKLCPPEWSPGVFARLAVLVLYTVATSSMAYKSLNVFRLG